MLELVTDLVNPDRARGRSLVVPRWWLDAARDAVAASGLGLVEVGERLAAKVGRPDPWTHGAISRFLSGKMVTDQIAEAMVVMFDLPRPAYYPRDMAEALLFRAAEAKRDQRLADADAAAAQLEAETRRQSRALGSPHGQSRGRGNRDRNVPPTRGG